MTEGYEMRSRLGDAARDVTEGKITLEEVTRAILDAIRDRNLRIVDQGAFYNPPEEPATIELDIVVQSRLGDSENLRLDRQDRSSEGQIGWLRLYAYSRQELDA
jgi:hypothetical protein